MKTTLMLAAVAAVAVQGASAVDFTITIDPGAKAIKDVRKTDCGTTLGYNGALTESSCDAHWIYQEYPDTAKVLREACENRPADLEGAVEWVALRRHKGIALLMVNTTSKEKKVRVNLPEPWSAIQPLYQAVSCDTGKILATTIPGETPLWRESAWEDTMGPGWFATYCNGEWHPRRLNPLTITIAPNTIQSVEIPLTELPKKK